MKTENKNKKEPNTSENRSKAPEHTHQENGVLCPDIQSPELWINTMGQYGQQKPADYHSKTSEPSN